MPEAHLVLDLPWPPSINHYWRWTDAGPRISVGGRAWRNNAVGAIYDAMQGRFPQLKGPLVAIVELWAASSTPERWDVDNFVKPVLDAIESVGIVENDSQFRAVVAIDQGRTEDGMARVTIADNLVWDRPDLT